MSKQSSRGRPSLTAIQRQWLEHLEAWQSQELSLREYATAHGLSVSGLYSAKTLFKRRDIWPGATTKVTERSEATLVPVRVRAPVARSGVAMLRVRLPNGLVVEVAEHAELSRCRELVSVLMGAAS